MQIFKCKLQPATRLVFNASEGPDAVPRQTAKAEKGTNSGWVRSIGAKVRHKVTRALKVAAVPFVLLTGAAACDNAEKVAGEALEEGVQLIEAGGDMAKGAKDFVMCPTGDVPMTTPECLAVKKSMGGNSTDPLKRALGKRAQAVCELAVTEQEAQAASLSHDTAKEERANHRTARDQAEGDLDDLDEKAEKMLEDINILKGKIAKADPEVADAMGWKDKLKQLEEDHRNLRRGRSGIVAAGSVDKATVKGWEDAEDEDDRLRLRKEALECRIKQLDREISSIERRKI